MVVNGNVHGLTASTAVEQRFVNPHDKPLEATYIFPLPDHAAVTELVVDIGGRIITAQLKERGEARKEYQAAVDSGHRAAIAEEERPGVFTFRVGNIMPGEHAKVRIRLTMLLPFDGTEATYRFPTVVAPRYIPGAPLTGTDVGDGVAHDTDQVPDASRITPPVLLPGYPHPVKFSCTLEVDPGGLPLMEVRSSLHALVGETSTKGRFRYEVKPGERLDRDVILRLRFARTDLATSLSLASDRDNEGEGTFMLTVVPPERAGEGSKPRDVVILIDRSGSMQGWKIVAARRAAARMVDSLGPRDRFNVLAFSTGVSTAAELTADKLHDATDRNRFRAVEFLSKLEAEGGTEILPAMKKVVDHLAGGHDDRDRVIVIVTDGQVGNEDEVKRLASTSLKKTRIFTVGIDQAVNAGFLKALSALGGGQCELVESEDRLDDVMDRMGRCIGTPVLSELSLVPSGLEILRDSVTPARLADVSADVPVVIMGRYRGEPHGHITLKAKHADGAPWSCDVVGNRSDSEALASIWARGHVRDLEDKFVAGGGDRDGLEKRIVETSLRFKALCRFTAFVAVDKDSVVNPGGQVHHVTQPVEPPAGWAALGSGTSVADQCMSFECSAVPSDTMGFLQFARREVVAKVSEAVEEMVAPHRVAQVNSPKPRKKARVPMPPRAEPQPEQRLAEVERTVERVLHQLEALASAPLGLFVEVLNRARSELRGCVGTLQSVGVDPDRIVALDRLVAELSNLLEHMAPLRDDLRMALSSITAGLSSWLGGASQSRREGFWK
jgi:Ca-activated chloride channel family protein